MKHLSAIFLTALAWSSTTFASVEIPEYVVHYEKYQEALARANRIEARDHAKNALESAREILPENSQDLVQLQFNYGQMLHATGKSEQAVSELEIAVDKIEIIFGENSEELIAPLLMLGQASVRQAKQALRVFRRANEIAEQHYVADSLQLATVKGRIGQEMVNVGWAKQARPFLNEAHDVLTANNELGQAAYFSFWLGKLELLLRNKERARAHFLAAVEHDSAAKIFAHANLVQLFEETGESSKATTHCQAIGASRPFNPEQQQVPLYLSAPEYPRRAQVAGREGWVVVNFTLDEEGFVRDPSVVDWKGHKLFGEAALKTMKKWRFAPRHVDGEPVATSDLRYKLTFELH